MNRQVDISSYHPWVMENVREFKALAKAESPEFTASWDDINLVLLNQFIMDSTEYGVRRWERMLKITPLPSDTLLARKMRILSRLWTRTPFTWRTLNIYLQLVCERYDLFPRFHEYLINLNAWMKDGMTQEELSYTLRQMIPANMGIGIKHLFDVPAKISVGAAFSSGQVLTIHPLLKTKHTATGVLRAGVLVYTAQTMTIRPMNRKEDEN